MIPLILLLLLIALGLTIGSAAGKVPLWTAVFVVVLVLLLGQWPR